MIFGLYKHKKGGIYLALGKVKHSEGGECVLYVGKSGVWVRPVEMFLDGRFNKLW